MRKQDITLVGAGLVGSLLAVLLAQRGYRVHLFERRPDPRRTGYGGGRSINLALAERGLHALRAAGLEQTVLAEGVPMRGRMVHDLSGNTVLQPYGMTDSEVIWSVHRGRLNLRLIEAAEAAGVNLHFDQRLESVDFVSGTHYFHDETTGSNRAWSASPVIGCDGAGSELRREMLRVADLGETMTPLGHSYKELSIPARDDGAFRMDSCALHIWPRGGYMCIALPNAEGSFTVTLFMPNEGTPSFASIDTPAEVARFFGEQFPDAVPLIPTLVDDFMGNPTGWLATLRLRQWNLDGKALLMGDAAHAIVPFHGQGMNAGFEDCSVLLEELDAGGDWDEVFTRFAAGRKPDADAIADMALDNYIEMRDSVADAGYRLRRELERELARRHPERFVPRYSMVMFRRMPYREAQARGRVQAEWLRRACEGKTALDQVDFAEIESWLNASA